MGYLNNMYLLSRVGYLIFVYQLTGMDYLPDPSSAHVMGYLNVMPDSNGLPQSAG